MSQCDDIKPYLDAYVDGELPDEEWYKAQVHLSQCASCVKEVHLIQNVTAALKDEEYYEVNNAFVDACMEKIKKLALPSPASAGFHKYKKTMTALAATAGIVGITLTAGLFMKRAAPKWKKAG